MNSWKSAKLVLYASGVYAIAVYLYRGFLPGNLPSTVTLLAIPLALVVIMISSDLMVRGRTPSDSEKVKVSDRSLSHQVRLLSRQVEVAGKSSQNYYDTVLLNRLRDLLIEKASIETGLDSSNVRKLLEDQRRGPQLLQDAELYNFLFASKRPFRGDRKRTLEMIADKIGDWKAP